MSNILNNRVDTIIGLTSNTLSTSVTIADYDTMTFLQVTYAATADVPTLFLVWCTHTNSYIATFTNNTLFRSCLVFNTEIKLSKMTNEVGFALHFLDPADSTIKPVTAANHMSITVNFTKYVK